MADLLERLQDAVASRYRIIRELGAGGMAVVFLAEDLRHRRQVALKVLRPELAAEIGPERFLREIDTAARLTHPHILPLHDSGEAGGFLYYVMPYVEGESLGTRLDRDKQLSVEDASRITREVAEALEYAHRHGVVHRDIKPGNIMLSEGGALVVDFGIARALEGAGEEGLTQTGTTLGTPLYMSPEQAGGGEALDGRSDQYSLACVLYEMLAGQPPFTGPTVRSVVQQHIAAPTPSISALRPGVPPTLARVVEKALAKVRADRYPSMLRFAEALAGAKSTPQMPVPAPRARRLYPYLLAGAALLLLALILPWEKVFERVKELIPSPQIRSLAVLPLANLSGDSGQDYFADGMTELLITNLAKLSRLRVISRTSVMRYRHPDESAKKIAHALGVDMLVMGSVQRMGHRVRITAQLIDAPREQSLWSDALDRETADVMTLQGELADSIAHRIAVRLTPEEQARLQGARVVSPEAYEEYLQGRYDWNKRTAGDLESAIQHFRRALQIDPGFAIAHSGLADAFVLQNLYGGRPPSVCYPQARAAALEALRLDESLAEAHACLGRVKLFYDHDWTGAEKSFRRALHLNPNYATGHHWYSIYLRDIGHTNEALDEAKDALTLDPYSPIVRTNLGDTYFYARRYDDAISEHRRTLELDPNFAPAHLYLGNAYLQARQLGEGIQEIERARALAGDSLYGLGALGYGYAIAGRRGEAELIRARLLSLRAQGRVVATEVALIEAGLGDVGSAIRYLELASEEKSGLNDLNVDPRFDGLRPNPRFQALLVRLGFPTQERVSNLRWLWRILGGQNRT